MQLSISCDGNNKIRFQNLTKQNLSQKCLNMQIQNPDESVKSIIWAHISKTVYVGIKTYTMVCKMEFQHKTRETEQSVKCYKDWE